MSKNKKNARREAYQARQEQEGRKVVNWIFGILVALAVAYIVYVATIV
ncbi:MAG: hypothetical protein J6K19_00775 [Prevotella sp.]|nr:hypothetical protein [Prevotella sp.]